MARRIAQPTTTSGPSEEQLDRWLGRFLLANDGDFAATVSAELRLAKGLTEKWRVIDRWVSASRPKRTWITAFVSASRMLRLGESGTGV